MSAFIGQTEVPDEWYVVLTEGDQLDSFQYPGMIIVDEVKLSNLDAAQEVRSLELGPTRIAKITLVEE